MAFLYFYENSHLICCIFQSHFALSKYRKTAMKFVFRFSFYYLTGVTLCNKWLSYVSLPLYLVVRNVITVISRADDWPKVLSLRTLLVRSVQHLVTYIKMFVSMSSFRIRLMTSSLMSTNRVTALEPYIPIITDY